MLRVIHAEHGAKPDELRRTLDEIETLPGRIDGLWHNRWRGYEPLVYQNDQVVPHFEVSVTDDGVHVNQEEDLWSLVTSWLRKFCGPSKPGLEQAVRTYGFVRSPNLVGEPLRGLLDCFVVNVFFQLTQRLDILPLIDLPAIWTFGHYFI